MKRTIKLIKKSKPVNISIALHQLNLTPSKQDEEAEKRSLSFKSPKLRLVKSEKRVFPLLKISKHYRSIIKPVDMLSLTKKVLSRGSKHSSYYRKLKNIRSEIPLMFSSKLYDLIQNKETVNAKSFNSINSNSEVGDKRRDKISAPTANKTTLLSESSENLPSPSNEASWSEKQRPRKPLPDLQELVPGNTQNDTSKDEQQSLLQKQKSLQTADLHTPLEPKFSGNAQNISIETSKTGKQRPLQLADLPGLASMLKNMPETLGYLLNSTNSTKMENIKQQKPLQSFNLQTISVSEPLLNLSSSNSTSSNSLVLVPFKIAAKTSLKPESSGNTLNSSNATNIKVENQALQLADKLSALVINKTSSTPESSVGIPQNISNNTNSMIDKQRLLNPADLQTSSENLRNNSNNTSSTVGNQRSNQPLDPQALAMAQVGYPSPIGDSTSGIFRVGGDQHHPALLQSVARSDELEGNSLGIDGGFPSQSNLLDQVVTSPEEAKEISEIKQNVANILQNEV